MHDLSFMRQKIAQFISILGHPFVTLPAFLLYVLFAYEELYKAIWTSGIVIGGMFIPMAVKTYRGTKRGDYTNLDVSNQMQRQKWYRTAVLLLILVIALLYFTDQSRSMRFNTVYAFLLLVTAQLVNVYIKSSMHVAYNVFLAFLILPIHSELAILFGFFVLAIAWSRLELKRHTMKEVISGTIIGLVLGITSFLTTNAFGK